jgi:aminoglycoside 3-N-acetyltransferase I
MRAHASARGIAVVFVPADDEGTHALDFYRAMGGTPTTVTFFAFSETSRPGDRAEPNGA